MVPHVAPMWFYYKVGQMSMEALFLNIITSCRMLARNGLVVTIVSYNEWVQDSNLESNNKTNFFFKNLQKKP